MASSINASTSGAGGVITTADNSGILNLQSNGTTVATVSSTGFSTPANQTINTANTFGFKNRIINGGMTIDQRNAGGALTPTAGAYPVDRWSFLPSTASKVTLQQNAGSVTPPAGFINYLGCTSTSAYSIGSGDYFLVAQAIEGLNLADLAWGSANAKTVTLSFWVRSSLTGTFGGSISNNGYAYCYPFTYTISSANTWEQKSITIAGPTAGTWLTTNGIGAQVNFSLGTGTTNSGTAGTWAAASYYSATGATSVVGTNGATWYVTGVQFEVGSQATSFDFRDYGRELILCQRYYENTGGGVTMNNIGTTYPNFYYKVIKRTTPTITNSRGVSVGWWTGGIDGWYQNSSDSAPNVMTFIASAEL